MRTVDIAELRKALRRELPRNVKGYITMYTTDDVLRAVDRAVESMRPTGCTCSGHDHLGGAGGCYVGSCGCDYRD